MTLTSMSSFLPEVKSIVCRRSGYGSALLVILPRVVSHSVRSRPAPCLPEASRPAACRQAPSPRARFYLEVFRLEASLLEGFLQATCHPVLFLLARCPRPVYYQVRIASVVHRSYPSAIHQPCRLAQTAGPPALQRNPWTSTWQTILIRGQVV